MANIVAFTEPINPPGACPILTPEQVWVGLKRRARRPHEFHKWAAKTEVLEESDNIIKRRVLVEQTGHPHSPTELISVTTFYPPIKTESRQDQSYLSALIISTGPKGAESGDIYLTHMLEWQHPDIETLSAEETETRKKTWVDGSQVAVRECIELMRQLAQNGQLEE